MKAAEVEDVKQSSVPHYPAIHIPYAITSLLKKELPRFDGGYTIDPCCGNGAIPQELRLQGITGVHGSDEDSTWSDVLALSDYWSTITMWKPSIIISAPRPAVDCVDLISSAWSAGVERVYLLLSLDYFAQLAPYFPSLRLSRIWMLQRPVADGVAEDSECPSKFGWFVFERKCRKQKWECGYLPLP